MNCIYDDTVKFSGVSASKNAMKHEKGLSQLQGTQEQLSFSCFYWSCLQELEAGLK